MVLIDKSAFAQAIAEDRARERLRELLAGEEAAICLEVKLEALYSARSYREYTSLERWFEDFHFIDPSPQVAQRTLAIQRKLAKRGSHRIPVADVAIAATAESAGAALLHYDKHFDLIAEVCGLDSRWIIPRGRGH